MIDGQASVTVGGLGRARAVDPASTLGFLGLGGLGLKTRARPEALASHLSGRDNENLDEPDAMMASDVKRRLVAPDGASI